MTEANTNPKAPKIIWGAQKIADRIERTPRAVCHFIETGQLPVKKIGRRICTTEDALIKLFSMLEGN